MSGALERTLGRRGTAAAARVPACDLCGGPLPAEAHRHLFDPERESLVCACQACAILFPADAGGHRHYRLVPDRRARLETAASLSSLGVPVSLVFLTKTASGDIVAHYPSPAGATRWDVDAERWQQVESRLPELRTLDADVEAALFCTAQNADEAWIVPLDDCYRLVGIIRASWKGLAGGSRVWEDIRAFFAELGASAGYYRENRKDPPWPKSASASPT